jgi:hypothetical protein
MTSHGEGFTPIHNHGGRDKLVAWRRALTKWFERSRSKNDREGVTRYYSKETKPRNPLNTFIGFCRENNKLDEIKVGLNEPAKFRNNKHGVYAPKPRINSLKPL